MSPKEASKQKKENNMVPSDRSKEVKHTSGGEGDDSSLASKLPRDALDQLQNMFNEPEGAEKTPEGVSTTEEGEKSKALGTVALGAEAAQSAEAVAPIESETKVRRTSRDPDARRMHEQILQISRDLTAERQAAMVGSTDESNDRSEEEPSPTLEPTPEPTPAPTPATVLAKKTEENTPQPPIDKKPKPFDRKKQEELWGVHDKIAPEDVPEGELTWEQYIAKRQAAQEGDVLHSTDKNGRTIVYDALTGHRVKKKDYDNQYDRSAIQEHRDKAMVDKDHADALDEHERRTESINDILRVNAEGEIAVNKSDQLRGLAQMGQELLALRDSTTNPELLTPELEKELASKEAVFKDLYELYSEKGLDASGLQFINDTYMEPYDDVDAKPYRGDAWHNDEKVVLEDIITSPDGDKAYVVVGEDGESRTVHAGEVDFKQELDAPEPEKEPEEKGIKKWWNKVRQGLYRLGGVTLWAQQWAQRANGAILEHGLDDDSLSEEEKERRRKRNRVAASIAGGAIAVALIGGAWALGSNVVDEMNSASAGGGMPNPNAHGWPGFEQANIDAFDSPTSVGYVDGGSVDQSGPKILPLEGSPGVETVEAAPVSSGPEIFVQSGDGGEALLSRYGIDPAKWYDVAERLYNEFPSHFYKEGADVRLMSAGPLPQGAQDIINSLR